MNSFGFMNTELTVDDLLDVSLSNGNTSSNLRRVVEDGITMIYDGENLRVMRYVNDGEVITECYDDEGNLHNWGSRVAVIHRDVKTNAVVYTQGYKHGEPIHFRRADALIAEETDQTDW